MIVGFNHNITYRGVGFHVQTEDSGIKNPQLVTLLYHGGTIIASKKTVYADILKVDNLSHVVEELAKEQHKAMLRRLTHAEFDQRIVDLGIPLVASVVPDAVPAEKASSAKAPVVKSIAVEGVPQPEPAVELPMSAPVAASGLNTPEVQRRVSEPANIVAEPIVDKFRKVQPEKDLDALIYAYLTGSDN